jgi:hypothetical protein
VTLIVGVILTLYVGLPSTVAVHAKSISTLERMSESTATRVTVLELGGTAIAKEHIAVDDRREVEMNSRINNHDKLIQTMLENQATIIERLANVQKLLEKHMEKL